MLRVCKRAAECRSRRRIYAAGGSATSSRPHSSERKGGGGGGEEEGDWRDVGVFWDFENCTLPSHVDPFVVRSNIERALRTAGFHGPISLSGCGNIHQVYRIHSLEALSETGFDLHHVPTGGKNCSDRALIIDVMLWTIKHSPPAHIMLITGDSDFSFLLHKLRLLNYNVLLAAPNKCHIAPALVHAASKIWVWPDIAAGLDHEHSSASPSDLLKDTACSAKEAVISRPTSDLSSNGGALETVSDPCEGAVNEFSKVSEAAWIPPVVVNQLISIVSNNPGTSYRKMSEELRAMRINPRTFGYMNMFEFLKSIPQLEAHVSDGKSLKDSTRYYVASPDKRNAGDGRHRSLDGSVGIEEPGSKASVNTDDESRAKKAGTGSLVSRLFTWLKGGGMK